MSLEKIPFISTTIHPSIIIYPSNPVSTPTASTRLPSLPPSSSSLRLFLSLLPVCLCSLVFHPICLHCVGRHPFKILEVSEESEAQLRLNGPRKMPKNKMLKKSHSDFFLSLSLTSSVSFCVVYSLVSSTFSFFSYHPPDYFFADEKRGESAGDEKHWLESVMKRQN